MSRASPPPIPAGIIAYDFFNVFCISKWKKKKVPSAHAAAPTPLEEGVSGAQGGRKSAIISRGAEMFSCLDGCPLSLFVPFALLDTHHLRLFLPSLPGRKSMERDLGWMVVGCWLPQPQSRALH